MPPSGYYYPNQIALIYLRALEEVMGRNGLNALLNLVGLQEYADNFPPGNLAKEFDFADFSSLNQGLFDIYGPRGGRGLGLRGGRATFDQGLKYFGAMAGVGDRAFRVLPMDIKVRIGLPALARIFTSLSDQISYVKTFDDHYVWRLVMIPVSSR
jgi:hypothetical protein